MIKKNNESFLFVSKVLLRCWFLAHVAVARESLSNKER